MCCKPFIEKIECGKCGAMNSAINMTCWDCNQHLAGKRFADEAAFRMSKNVGRESYRGSKRP